MPYLRRQEGVWRKPMNRDIFHFDFTVTDLSEAACDELMKQIATWVEEAGGTIGGGFAAEEEQEAGDEQEPG
jgi:hypothetical protein